LSADACATEWAVLLFSDNVLHQAVHALALGLVGRFSEFLSLFVDESIP
jgi:hypothetical protein